MDRSASDAGAEEDAEDDAEEDTAAAAAADGPTPSDGAGSAPPVDAGLDRAALEAGADGAPPSDAATHDAPRILALSAGEASTCALLAGGSVKCWGYNSVGQLGLGDVETRGDEPGEMGSRLPAVSLGRSATAIAAGGFHACALLDSGKLKCWGDNSSGAVGLGDPFARGDDPDEMGDALPAVSLGANLAVTQVVAGEFHTCAVLENGALKCWGANGAGQLGLGDTTPRGDRPGQMGDALPPVDLGAGRSVRSLSLGYAHTCAVLDDETVKCWGDNARGQLGLGDDRSRGGGPGQMGDALPAVALGAGRRAKAVSAGKWHTCALLDAGAVKCWGASDYGMLGLGDTAGRGSRPAEMGDALPEVSLGSQRVAVALRAGSGGFDTCATFDDGALKCWGYNTYGQLGLGHDVDRGNQPGQMGDRLQTVDLGQARTIVEIAVGGYHACARLDDGRVKCWGVNLRGELGLGDRVIRGHGPGELGDALPAVAIGGD